MISSLKTPGLALVAVLALSAAIAASASAEGPGVITTDGLSVTLKGVEQGSGENYLEAAGTKIECPGSHVWGHKINVTPHEPIPYGASEVTITRVRTNCNAAVDMNGCDYQWRDATTTGAVTGTYGVKEDIVCPQNEKIRITSSPCNLLIGPQTLTGFHFTNAVGPPEWIVFSGEASVSATACGIPVTAIQRWNVRFEGYNASGGTTEVTFTHN